MALIETLSTGISIINTAKTLYDWITGNTIAKKVDAISNQLTVLDKHLYYLPEQEIWDLKNSQKQIAYNVAVIQQTMSPLQHVTGNELIISKPISSPQRLRGIFEKNPEDILSHIQPITKSYLSNDYMSDPTLIPVTFTRWNQPFVGLMKIGYACDFLNLEYKPYVHSLSSGMVLTENFDNKWETRWEIRDKRRRIKFYNNTLELGHDTWIKTGNKTWDNYCVTLDVKFLRKTHGENINGGINFRIHEHGNYRFGIWPERNSIILGKWDSKQSRWDNISVTGYSAKYNQWYELRAKVYGNLIQCYANGSLIFNINDYNFPSGGISLQAWEGDIAYRNVQASRVR
ncbi:DUF1080 domain-containing protein [Desulfococcaceae bacterium HSG9]|nr:DUF1080 domain-containing protein [Desulfococcaceae bacterium HSG9]